MARQDIENRVDRLDMRVSDLEKLPERVSAVESQIVQLRAEIRDEFSAVRREIGERFEDFGVRLDGRFEAFRTEVSERFEETNRHVRVLHEDVISRLALIQEGQTRKRRSR